MACVMSCHCPTLDGTNDKSLGDASASCALMCDPPLAEMPMIEKTNPKDTVDEKQAAVGETPALRPGPVRQRSIRFADEMGKPIATFRTSPQREDKCGRALLLLVCIATRKFEFVHIEYNLEDKITFNDLLRQIPCVATDEILARQCYMGVCRIFEKGQEMLNRLSIQSYGLRRNELLAAVPEGFTRREIVRVASRLIEQPNIIKAVRRGTRGGRGLRRLKNKQELDQLGIEASMHHQDCESMPTDLDPQDLHHPEHEPIIQETDQRRTQSALALVSTSPDVSTGPADIAQGTDLRRTGSVPALSPANSDVGVPVMHEDMNSDSALVLDFTKPVPPVDCPDKHKDSVDLMTVLVLALVRAAAAVAVIMSAGRKRYGDHQVYRHKSKRMRTSSL